MKGYTIRRSEPLRSWWLEKPMDVIGSSDPYEVVNPSGVPIAFGCSWRTAKKIAKALNAVRDIGWLS